HAGLRAARAVLARRAPCRLLVGAREPARSRAGVARGPAGGVRGAGHSVTIRAGQPSRRAAAEPRGHGAGGRGPRLVTTAEVYGMRRWPSRISTATSVK